MTWTMHSHSKEMGRLRTGQAIAHGPQRLNLWELNVECEFTGVLGGHVTCDVQSVASLGGTTASECMSKKLSMASKLKKTVK